MPSSIPETTEGRHKRPPRIDLKLTEMKQLFNSMDPSPFNDKDLDHDAEEFIVSWAHEYGPDDPLSLHIYLEQWPAEDPTELIREAIHNYFAYRAELNQLEFRRLMKQGRTTLLIGLLFLAACLLTSKMLLARETGAWVFLLQEGLTIAGWVAMWRPMQLYLYDWWPVRQEGRIYQKLSKMPIEVIQKGKELIMPHGTKFS
jgi:hypothetical protein